jgi:hypothetical protein
MIYPRMTGLGDAAYNAIVAQFATRAVDPEGFARIRPGRPIPNPETCLKIQCGAISQEEAGLDLLADCAFDGFAGAMSCASPLCAPYCGGSTAASVARASQPLPVAPRIAQMVIDIPKRFSGDRGCNPVYYGAKFGGPYGDSAPCGCGASGFIEEHPFLAVALLGLGAWGLYEWRTRG